MRRVLVTLTTLFLLAPLGQVRGMEPVVEPPVPVVEAMVEGACQPIQISSPLVGDEYMPGMVTFAWEPMSVECLEELGLEEEVYLIQIYKIKADEETMYAEFKSYGPTEDVDMTEPGKYRWVVSLLVDEPMYSSDPEVEPRFYILDEGVQVPNLVSPIDGVWLPEGMTSLTWEYAEEPPVKGSRADTCTWNVRYMDADSMEWMMVEGLTETELALLFEQGMYEWSAQCETYWARGLWSEAGAFNVDGTMPTVAIAGTTPLTVAAGATLQFSGTAEDLESGMAGLRFRIMQGTTEVLAWTDAASLTEFAGSATLPAGSYQLEVEATDMVGNVTVVTRDITVVVPTPNPEGGIGGDPNGTAVVVAQVAAPGEPVQLAVSVPAPTATEETVTSTPSPTPTPDQGDVAGASTDTGNTQSTTFWWWLLLTAVAIFIIWFLVGRRRGEDEQQN